jgi:signal transduction histidine kinase
MVKMNAQILGDKRFRVTIKDNGSLFKPENSNGSGRGIANIRSRANLINARIAWQEPEDGGNLFSLEIAGK